MLRKLALIFLITAVLSTSFIIFDFYQGKKSEEMLYIETPIEYKLIDSNLIYDHEGVEADEVLVVARVSIKNITDEEIEYFDDIRITKADGYYLLGQRVIQYELNMDDYTLDNFETQNGKTDMKRTNGIKIAPGETIYKYTATVIPSEHLDSDLSCTLRASSFYLGKYQNLTRQLSYYLIFWEGQDVEK